MIVARRAAALWLLTTLGGGCSDTADTDAHTPPATGGAVSMGGSTAATGGTTSPTGGRSTGTGGATSSGGTTPTGGASTGGVTGGTAAGGTPGGDTTTGGTKATGGAPSASGGGGTPAGGAATSGGGGTAGANPSGGSAGSTHSGVWNVMMLGDSITASTCYPQLLSQQFKAGGHSNFAFIGSQTTSQSCNGAPAVQTEGHGGYGVTYLPANSTRGACTKSSGCGSYAELQQWAMLKPDIVLMHYGTNDVWDGQSAQNILAAYTAVIAEFRKQNPNVIFFVSKIIKLSPNGCGNCLSNVMALADAVSPDWASANSLPTSPIHIVNDYDSGFDPTSAGDAADGVHPTAAGAMKMATATYADVTARGYF
jgi:lysophospholipase L1-like esterase